MKTFDFPQYSDEWWDVRRGIPTCSEFKRIITPTTHKLAGASSNYINFLIAQKIRMTPNFFTERPMSRAMRDGVALEPQARNFYAFDRSVEVQQVGFCLSDCGRYGGSPDGLVGEDGGLELKCPKVETHVRYLLERKLPDEYASQVHGHLLVSGRKWWDFMSYVGPDVDPFIIRVEPNEFTRALKVVLEQFLEKYEKTIAKLKGEK